MKYLSTIITAATIAMLSPTAAFAHDDATLDKVTTPNGGQLRMAGIYHIELVLAKGDSKTAKENPVIVYVTDHADKKITSQGMKASVTLFGAGKKATAELKPDGDNRLKGMASYSPTADLKAVVSLTGTDGKTVQARFTPLAPPPAAHGSHAH